jgi:hypothetical protein
VSDYKVCFSNNRSLSSVFITSIANWWWRLALVCLIVNTICLTSSSHLVLYLFLFSQRQTPCPPLKGKLENIPSFVCRRNLSWLSLFLTCFYWDLRWLFQFFFLGANSLDVGCKALVIVEDWRWRIISLMTSLNGWLPMWDYSHWFVLSNRTVLACDLHVVALTYFLYFLHNAMLLYLKSLLLNTQRRLILFLTRRLLYVSFFKFDTIR